MVRVNRLSVKSRPRNPIDIEVNGKRYTVYQSRFVIGRTAILVSDHMSGKMHDVPSISTSCLDNPMCKARLEKGIGVCKHCFAKATLSRYDDAGKNAKANYELLNREILPDEVLPTFCDNVEIVRGESFGDVGSVTQARNYIHIVRKNPHCMFAIWTKNPHIWTEALKIEGKPENLNLIISSLMLNHARESIPAWADKVFTVYEKDKASPEQINCGARSCNTCRRCYRKGKFEFVNEYLK